VRATSETLQWANLMGTEGFEFVEYTAPDAAELGHLFETMGFTRVARHHSKDVSLYRQGGNFVVNAEPNGLAQQFARLHDLTPVVRCTPPGSSYSPDNVYFDSQPLAAAA
jgi:4-hydroxyphenylpyruvate dioxygenase-like putative hemolysin